ncbi:SDR family oxidoreductase (plasmid) [Methylocapsa polymorpha]|uniref:SDR family oxidoreductase n=1 Tax=Methylocapsa polymorpha TaxID=3080828 RepID=A0ABZ0HWI2_9HYPH|nr:SDR family oxidoreductase [Methylocapsa sp. RX1]WOJ91644.1 SDR family oxidoreductase [Methylocapsa sp. RX1]
MTELGSALITGASSGIGAAYADRLAKRGFDLVLVAHNEQHLKTVADQVVAETGVKVDIITADLTSRTDVRRVEQRLRSDNSIALLVNDAGIGTPKPVLDEDIDFLESVVELNVVTAHRLAVAAAQVFAGRRRGGIINLSSIAVLHPEQVNATYGATKAFILNLSQGLHREAGPKGVKLQVVLPGATRTEFFSRFGMSIDSRFPAEQIMEPADLVDAALAGFDQGELVTIPSLPDMKDWERFVAARLALGPNLSHSKPAARYGLTGAGLLHS